MARLEISRARSLVFALLPAATLLLAAEVTLRLCGFRFEPEAIRVEYSGDFAARMFQDHLTSRHFVPDPVTLWKPRPSEPPFNSLGYRGEELPEEKAAGEFRILAVGDSNTVGHQASWVDEIPKSIDAGRLGAERVTTINAGVYGYTSYQGKRHLARFLRYRPDLVLIGFGGNEDNPNSRADKDYRPYVPHPLFAWLGGRLRLFELVESLSFRWSLSRSGGGRRTVARVSLDDYESDLGEMIGLARGAGAVAVLATRPLAFDYRGTGSSNPLKPYLARTWKVAKEHGAGLVDLDAMADHSLVLFADHAHFNVAGHEFVGAAVARAIPRILEGRARVVSRPRFEPRGAFEKATDAAGRTVSRWSPLAESLDLLRRHPAVRAVTTVLDLDAAAGAGDWDLTLRPERYEERKPEAVDGALCIGPGPARITLGRPTPELDAGGPTLVWIEAVSRSDVELWLAWRTTDAAGAADGISVPQMFYGEKTEVSVRYFHVLPAGVRAIRIEARVRRWLDAFCLRRVLVAAIDVGEPAEPPVSAAPGYTLWPLRGRDSTPVAKLHRW